jgi:hypothetical protein
MSETIDPNLKAIESAFRALTPAAATIPRDRLLYEAGRRSVQRRGWPILTGLFATSTLLLGLHIATQPEPAVQVVVLPPPVEPSRVMPPEVIIRETLARPPQTGVLPLILRGAPDYLPPDPAARRLTAQSRLSATGFGHAAPLPPPAEWLGLPDDAFRKPVKPHPGFGPIQRGEA